MKFSCDPKVWGRPGWTFLHSIALCYPIAPTDVDRTRYKLFFLMLPHVLPCVHCREHLLQYYSKHSSLFEKAFDNRFTLSMFLIDLHNAINQRLGKAIVPYRQVIGRYDTQLLHPFVEYGVCPPSGNESTGRRGRT